VLKRNLKRTLRENEVLVSRVASSDAVARNRQQSYGELDVATAVMHNISEQRDANIQASDALPVVRYTVDVS